MSKKLIIIISVVLTLTVIILVGFYILNQNNNSNTGGVAGGFKNFFPFGGNNTPAPSAPVNNSTTTNPSTSSGQANFTQKLRKLSTEGVAGAGTLDSKAGPPAPSTGGRAGTVVRYIEKATGHIFEVELFSPKSSRISNTTIPTVYDALWLNKNTSLIARYLKADDQTVDTYSLNLKSVSTTTPTRKAVGEPTETSVSENTISGIAFPGNINDLSVFGSSVFYLVKNSDSSSGFTANFDGTKKKQIWSSPIKELLSQYVNLKTVALTTKPAQNIPGFLYFVDTGTGGVKKVLGDILGLSTLVSLDGNSVLYLEESSSASMSVFDQKNKTYTKITPTTFPEKCAWSNKDKNIIYCAVPRVFLDGGSLPSWYKGLTSFSDDIWKYNIKNNTSGLVENLSNDAGQSIDVIKPILSENEQYLVFMNKTDNTLWSLDLTK